MEKFLAVCISPNSVLISGKIYKVWENGPTYYATLDEQGRTDRHFMRKRFILLFELLKDEEQS